MMVKPRIYADFQNADSQGRVRLNCVGTLEDLSKGGIELQEGLVLSLYSDDLDANGESDELQVEGTVTFSPEEHGWGAIIDWASIRHASDTPEAQFNGHSSQDRAMGAPG